MTDKDKNADKKEPILLPPKVIKHSADNTGEKTERQANDSEYRGSDE